MDKRSNIDTFGVVALTSFALLLAFNQVVIKVTNAGLQPAFFAGVRSIGAMFCVWLWLKYRGIPLHFPDRALQFGILTGCVFAIEFLALFIALDLTTVARSGIIFYSMPLWMAVIAHFATPDDRVNPVKALGLILALAGVVLAFSDRQGGEASIWGDLAALVAAIGWASTAMLALRSQKARIHRSRTLYWGF